jgi:hypothetical protein
MRASIADVVNGLHQPPKITAAAFIVMVILVAAFDCYMGLRYGADQTVSAVLQDWGGRFPVLVLIIGLILGHLFWPFHGR